MPVRGETSSASRTAAGDTERLEKKTGGVRGQNKNVWDGCKAIIPDCVRLSCLCLLFRVARPAWRLRPILHPVELWIALTWTQVFSLWCSHATAYFTGVCIKSINKTMKNALKCIWQTTSHATKYFTKIKKYPWYMQTVHTFHWKKYLDLLSAPREAVAARARRAGVW